MKTKKILFAVFTAALVTVFMVGCNVLQDDTILKPVKEKNKVVPDRKVRVKFNLGKPKSNARTILPDTDDYLDVENFPYFKLFIHDEAGAVGSYVNLTAIDPLNAPFVGYFEYSVFEEEELILVEDEHYTIHLVACNLNDDTNANFTFMAYGATVTPIEFKDEVEIEIELHEIIGQGDVPLSIGTLNVNYTGNGTFSWVGLDTHVAGYTTATLTLYSMTTTSIVSGVNGISVKTTSAASHVEVPSGYYRLTLQLGNSGFQSVTVFEMVHIYSGFITKYLPPIANLPTLRRNVHTITFDYGTSVNNTPTDIPANHGDTIYDLAIAEPLHSTPINYHFDGWYYDDSYDREVEDTDLVLDSTDLFAKWADNPTPLAGDYDITNLTQYDDDIIVPVSIVPKVGKSSGARTIHYDGSLSLPSAVGTYAVTFNVAGVASVVGTPGWKVASNLNGGTLEIVEVPTPDATMYKFLKMKQSSKNITAVAIEPISDTSLTGAITVKYNGNTTLPTEKGTYAVTFDVAGVSHVWKAVNNLIAGNLEIEDPKQFTITFAPGGDAEIELDETLTTNNFYIYDAVAGTLDIKLTVVDDFEDYLWISDFETNILNPTNIGTNSNVLELNLRTDTDDLRWFAPGERFITLIVEDSDNKTYSTKFKFTPTTP